MNIYTFIQRNVCNKNDITFIELGPEKGSDSTEFIKLLGTKSYKYYIVEPDNRNIRILKSKGIHKKAKIIQGAVGAKDGVSKFNISCDMKFEDFCNDIKNLGWSRSGSIKQPKEHLKLHPWCKFDFWTYTNVYSLDSLFNNEKIDFCNFIWADIQGAEVDLISGGKNALLKTKYLYTEFENTEQYDGQINLAQIQNLLGKNWKKVGIFNTNNVLMENLELP